MATSPEAHAQSSTTYYPDTTLRRVTVPKFWQVSDSTGHVYGKFTMEDHALAVLKQALRFTSGSDYSVTISEVNS